MPATQTNAVPATPEQVQEVRDEISARREQNGRKAAGYSARVYLRSVRADDERATAWVVVVRERVKA